MTDKEEELADGKGTLEKNRKYREKITFRLTSDEIPAHKDPRDTNLDKKEH